MLLQILDKSITKIILPHQSAFIKDRQLLKNTLLISELVSGCHKDKGPKRLTIKVDITKAFDTLRWDFILHCLAALNLPDQYVRWIKECITTPSFSVGINGAIHGFFKNSRGIRQSDHLSPYLFGIAMNEFSSRVKKIWVSSEVSSVKAYPPLLYRRSTHLYRWFS